MLSLLISYKQFSHSLCKHSINLFLVCQLLTEPFKNRMLTYGLTPQDKYIDKNRYRNNYSTVIVSVRGVFKNNVDFHCSVNVF